MEPFLIPYAQASASRAYVGCRTSAFRGGRGRGIEVFNVAAEGSWHRLQTLTVGENPSFLLVDEENQALHCVHGDGAAVSSFRIEADGRLFALSSQPSEGRNPVHLALSATRRWLLVANYATGSVVSFSVQADGSLGEVTSRLDLPDHAGPHRSQQQGAHPHQVVLDPSGRWLLVPDKGCDAVHTVRVDEERGSLGLVATFATAPLSGPRHMVFQADGNLAWIVLELSSQVLAVHFDSSTGSMRAVQRVPTVPESFTGENTSAGIALSADQRFLFVSNRGHGSVVRYVVNAESGELSSPIWAGVAGTVPRFITTSPSGDLVIANEDADTIVSVDFTNSKVRNLATTGSPVCIAFSHHAKGIT